MNQHKSIARRLLPLAVAALFCSLFFTLIQCQITIGSKQQELAAVRETAQRPAGPKRRAGTRIGRWQRRDY